MKLSRRAVENDVCEHEQTWRMRPEVLVSHTVVVVVVGRGEISDGPGASGRSRSVSGRTAATGYNGGDDYD